MTIVLFGIRNCDTCRRARKWLEASGVDYRFHDLRLDGVDRTMTDRWMDAVGAERLVNRKGRTWRDLDQATRASLDDETLRALLADQPTLIKRPVVDWPDGETTVGFDEDHWENRLQGDGVQKP